MTKTVLDAAIVAGAVDSAAGASYCVVVGFDVGFGVAVEFVTKTAAAFDD